MDRTNKSFGFGYHSSNKLICFNTGQFLCLALEFSMGNILDFISLTFGPNERKFCLDRIKFQPGLWTQADTPINECCNFSRDFFAFETDKNM